MPLRKIHDGARLDMPTYGFLGGHHVYASECSILWQEIDHGSSSLLVLTLTEVMDKDALLQEASLNDCPKVGKDFIAAPCHAWLKCSLCFTLYVSGVLVCLLVQPPDN